MNFNIGIITNLEKLIESRLLIQANSGGGKSYAIRKLLEETNGKVQQIVLDLEGEFFSLREKFDFLVFGNEGDYPIHIKYADKMARTLLEHNVSAIIDLYELKHFERITFVKRFLESMINAPKNLWHPCIVIIDEAHIFAPEKGSAESMNAVIDLCTRGRKRGYCAVLATQRLSKLHKDAAAECNNKLIGRTGLDVDMKRASDELGFNSKADVISLRGLQPGEFFAFGPAISNHVTKFKIAAVKTTHPKTGARLMSVPPASSKIKNILSQFKDLPQEAEKELRTESELKKEITRLKIQLTTAQKQQKVKEVIKPDQKIVLENKELKSTISDLNKSLLKYNKNIEAFIMKYKDALKKIGENIDQLISMDINLNLPKPEEIKIQDIKIKDVPVIKLNNTARNYHLPQSTDSVIQKSVGGGAVRMLKAAAMFYPDSITRARMGALAGLSFRSGSFGTYLATLKRNGLLTGEGNLFAITQEGLQEAGDVEPLPTDPEILVEMWCGIVKGGASRMLRALADVYPESLSRAELGEQSDISHTSGSFGTYLATLKRNGLITGSGQSFKAADELFN